MIILGKYDELGPGFGFKSMREDFEKKPYPNKDIIVQYMKSGHVGVVTASKVIDVFTNKATNIEKVIIDDGVYVWDSPLIYYIERYNLRLQKDFEDHVLKQMNKAS